MYHPFSRQSRRGRLIFFNQPGHEYTKGNVKFAITVAKDEPVVKLQELAENNKETQGKATIGDEKVSILSVY